MFTNRYIFIYSSVMVIIVAAILSTAATSPQDQCRKLMRKTAKIQSILNECQGIESTKENAQGTLQKNHR
jgi:hypothetical protein